MFRTLARRGFTGAAAFGLAIAISGCDDLLSVENPGAIDESDVTDPAYAPQMVNATINEFQTHQGYLAYAGAIFTDEALNGHNFTQWEDIDLRIIEDDNSSLLTIYQRATGARAIGDDMVSRLREVVEHPEGDLGMATALAYTGYAYTRLGEYFCHAPIEDDGPGVGSDGILAVGVERFDEAIRIAQAASGAEASRILNLARVGAARASLQQGNFQDAVSYASQVDEGFRAWIRHVSAPTTHRNYIWGETQGTNRTLGVDPSFVGLNDLRVRHTQASRTGHNQQTQLFTPAQSRVFETWDPSVPLDIDDDDLIEAIGFENDTDMELASHLEAQYILAEAGGMSDAEVHAFIDERRAVGGHGPFTGSDLDAELRDQRRRDFYLSGHRLGDLRRYLALYGIDEFPSGPHPNNDEWGWGNYGSATCFIPHRNEGVSNPNYQP